MKTLQTFKIGAGILAAFIATEAVLRLLGFPSINTNTFDKDGLVIFKPNQSFLLKDRCFASVLKTNSQGFHAKEYALEKPAGTYRIVILGDSFVEGVQVPIEKTFPYLLEQKLNSGPMAGSGKTYEVIPIAKSGNGTLMNITYGRAYALAYHPDLIINAFITNDLEDDAKPGAGTPAPLTGSLFELSLKHFFFERSLMFERWWMNIQVVKSQMKRSQPAVSSSTAPLNESRLDSFILAQINPETLQAKALWANEEKALKEMKSFVQTNGAQFLLVQLAEGYLIDPPELMTRYYATEAEATKFKQEFARQKLADIALRNNILFFSTQPYFERIYQSAGVSPILSCDNHYNELGHEQAAEAIYGFLASSSSMIVR